MDASMLAVPCQIAVYHRSVTIGHMHIKYLLQVHLTVFDNLYTVTYVICNPVICNMSPLQNDPTRM